MVKMSRVRSVASLLSRSTRGVVKVFLEALLAKVDTVSLDNLSLVGDG